MRSFYNGRKAPLISPILKGNKYVSNFKEKAYHLNGSFSMQCFPGVNSSVFSDKFYLTSSSLQSFTINWGDTLITIRSLDINKVHGQDDILVRMLKIFDDAIAEPLKMFENFLKMAIRTCFLAGGKKLMWFLFIKKRKVYCK